MRRNIALGTWFEAPLLNSENMILEFGTRSCVSSQLMSLPNSSMRKIHSIFPRLLERLAFDVFRILSERLQVSVTMFPFSEHTCSRGDGVSLGIESCHPTVLSVIASVIHDPPKFE